MARRFAAEGAAGVCVADRDGAAAAAVAAEIRQAGVPALATRTDVAVEYEVVALIEAVERQLGPIDLFCAKAGVAFGHGLDAPDQAGPWPGR
jgi:NAD(P)-dependent dehydrogenase (short-subunit alcohol dehydrogenase family)